MVEGDGFEPSKAEPADLQSAPFGHSGTPPGIFILNRRFPNASIKRFSNEKKMVEGDGFEPSKAEPADLQSAPFGHSGTPPGVFLIFLRLSLTDVFPNASIKCGAHIIKLGLGVNTFFVFLT